MPYKNRFRENSRALRLSELDLANHEVADHLKQWFARSRVDYLLWFPFRLTDALAGLLVSLLFIGTASAFGHVVIATLYLALIGWCSLLLHRLESDPAPDFESTLGQYRPFTCVRAVVHASVTVIGIVLLPQPLLLPLLMLYCLLLKSSATGTLTLTHVATVNVIVMALPVMAALVWVGGVAELLGAILVLAFAGYSISVVYNNYYLFATRRLRTKTMQEANETVRMLLDEFVEQSNECLWQIDRSGMLIDVPKRFAEIFGIDPRELYHKPLQDMMGKGPETDRILALTAALEEFKNLPFQLCIDGKTRWISVSGRPQFDRDGVFSGYRGFATDISARRDAEERAAYLAHYDPLTSLPNRDLFGQCLADLLRRRRSNKIVAVMYVDIDQFKEVNDSYGHAIGDAVLQETARRLEEIVGPDNNVGRLNGDEFAVVLKSLDDREEAFAIADAILNRMDDPIALEKANISLSASIGLAFGPDHGSTGEALLRSADIALYDAKMRAPRSLSLFREDMQKSLQDRRSLQADLRQAVCDASLDLHYQPIVDVQSGKICGYEALLRWQHPERGAISPEKFIALAEESGLIVPLGEWVIRQALAEASNWPSDLTLAVNISPLQLRSERLLPTIVHALSHSGVDPERFEIEITESVLLDHSEENLEKLHRLHELGIRIALDDFGTGFSSLNYLRSFPFDKIKIDRCFVQDMTENRGNRAIIEAVLSLAAELDMVTTAEGVETTEQLELLRARGCRQVQGYLFSRPQPADQLDYALGRTMAVPDTGRVTRLDKCSGKKELVADRYYRGQQVKSAR